jgi:hypothetical protein
MVLSSQIPIKDKEKHKKDPSKKKGIDLKESKVCQLHKALYISKLDKIAIVEEKSDII